MRVLYLSQGVTVHDRRFLEAMLLGQLDVGFIRLEARDGALPLPAGVLELSPTEVGNPFFHGRFLSRRRWLREAVSNFRPDVVHAGPIQSGAFLAAASGVGPLISMSWGSDVLRDADHLQGRIRARWAFARSQLLLCDCQAVRRRAIQLGMPEQRIVVFPWGADLRHFRPQPARAASAADRRQRVVLVSARSLEPIYGPEILLEGFLKAWRAFPALKLTVLGDGSLRPELQARVQSARAESAVRFEGAVEEQRLARFFEASDLYISASRSDGSSVTLLQAMACGLPPIVSDIPANREWVTPGENGWLFEDGSPESLAQTLLGALETRGRWRPFGAASRKRVERDADWGHNQQMLLDAYDMVVHGR